MVNFFKSDSGPVVFGVPQGTVLGHLLFSLYINEISVDNESEIRLFADDCVCYHEIKDKEDTTNFRRLLVLKAVGPRNGYEISICQMQNDAADEKQTHKMQASYTLEGTVLENVASISCHGVDLIWNTHISNICTKANRTIGLLRQNLCLCLQNVKEVDYKGLVWPVLEYGSSVWDLSTKGLQG